MVLWIVYALASAFAAAVAIIFIKLGTKHIDPTLIATIHGVTSAIFLVATSFAMNKFQHFSFQTLFSEPGLYIILAGIFGGLSWVFFTSAFKYGFASKVYAIDRISIVFVVILSIFVLGETLYVKTAAGALLMLLGAYLISTAGGM